MVGVWRILQGIGHTEVGVLQKKNVEVIPSRTIDHTCTRCRREEEIEVKGKEREITFGFLDNNILAILCQVVGDYNINPKKLFDTQHTIDSIPEELAARYKGLINNYHVRSVRDGDYGSFRCINIELDPRGEWDASNPEAEFQQLVAHHKRLLHSDQ